MSSESGNEFDRRRFLLSSLSSTSAAWLALHWPAMMSAAEHAAHARQAANPPRLEVLSGDEAAEVEAVASRITPATIHPARAKQV